MDEKKEVIFASGIYFKMPKVDTPDFVLLDASIKAHDLFLWCQSHQDNKGWVNITIKRSKSGVVYADLNNWKPTVKDSDTGEVVPDQQQPVRKTFTPEEKETMSVDDIASLSEVAFQEMSESNPF